MALNKPLAVSINTPLSTGVAGSVTTTTPVMAPFERIQNGDFSSAAGWDDGGGWTIAAGQAECTSPSTFLVNTLASPITAGKTVSASVTIVADPSTANWLATLYNTDTLATQTLFLMFGDGPGTYTNEVTASDNFNAFRIRESGTSGMIIDNVSLIA